MTELDHKILEYFPGKAVRKDLTALMKKGANVPTYVLEYLLGMYCATDDEEAIREGLEKIKKILANNYVRPDQSEYVKSKIRENGQYTDLEEIFVATANAGARLLLLPEECRSKCDAMKGDLKNEIRVMYYQTPLDAAKKALGLD